ncbi:MAG: 6-carboxytetrahydropterin synthase [Fimbriimonadaceae bacterium]|nr:6-carboxytetrahydropterin synthase [Chitinophagales bacterium]
MIYLTRKEHFNAAHRLFNNKWSEEKNSEVFGKCANKNWHGHNYNLYVTIKGEPDPDTGFIVDAKKLGDLIKTEITDKFDHKNLNIDTNYFDVIQPSTENFCKVIWNILEPKITQGVLHSVRLHETENIYAEYFGD